MRQSWQQNSETFNNIIKIKNDINDAFGSDFQKPAHQTTTNKKLRNMASVIMTLQYSKVKLLQFSIFWNE